jgi:hypothetical protein
MRGISGQSTIEYVLVLLAFLATITALGAIWAVAQSGALQRDARDSMPHNLEGGVTIGFLQDLSSF